MKKILGLCAAVLLLWPSTMALAQIPGAPAAPAPPAVPGAPPAPGVPVAVPAAAPPPTTLWSFLGLSHEQCEKCRLKICSKPIGKLINNMMQPMILASGGILHPLCPPGPTPEELAKLLDPNNLNVSPAEAVAAQIQAEQAQVKAKVAAIRYLATVDCHYYPEAGDALVAMLRKDNNECVRFEAALALTKGCCCNKKTIAGLMLAVSGETKDGNKAETSDRVKAMALNALNLCMAKVQYVEEPVRPEFPPPKDIRPEVPPGTVGPTAMRIKLNPYYTEYLATVPFEQVVQQAGRVLAQIAAPGPTTGSVPTGQRGVLNMWAESGTHLVKDEISFDEAALATPFRTLPKTKPADTPIRASLGFQVADIEPVSLNQETMGQFKKKETKLISARQPETKGPLAPVPWPVKSSSESKNSASERMPDFSAFPRKVPQASSDKGPVQFPTVNSSNFHGKAAPVPWPVMAPTGTVHDHNATSNFKETQSFPPTSKYSSAGSVGTRDPLLLNLN